jgi:hypothetical protein
LSYWDRRNLRLFWKNREELNWDESDGHCGNRQRGRNGDFAIRPYALLFKTFDLRRLLGNALINLLSFCLKADTAGVEQGPKRHLVIEKQTEPCNAGLELDQVRSCPLMNTDDKIDVERDLKVFEQVIRQRSGVSFNR